MTNLTSTTNGGVQYKSSKSKVLDLFFIAGNSSQIDQETFITKVEEAFKEDPLLTLKVLFWSRDVRGGAGQKLGFINWFFLFKDVELKKQFLHLLPTYGYWKDLVKLYNAEYFQETILNIFIQELVIPETPSGLVTKWLPRKGKLFNDIRRTLKITPKELRKLLVNNSDTTEQRMSANKWETINYPHVPSVCMLRNKDAFSKHDAERFVKYLEEVKAGKNKINSSTLYPSDLVGKYTKGNLNLPDYLQSIKEDSTIEELWNNLPDYLQDSDESFIVLADMSSSMFDPRNAINSSIALAIYLSERNKTQFKNTFITFNTTPEIHIIQGNTLLQKITNCIHSQWGGSTNLDAAFQLILNTAKQFNIPQNQLPKNLLVISDMQFDQTGKVNIHEKTKNDFKSAGYEIPQIIFWNLGNYTKGVPAIQYDNRAILVSGYSPTIVTSLLKGDLNPFSAMQSILQNKRYDIIEETFNNLK